MTKYGIMNVATNEKLGVQLIATHHRKDRDMIKLIQFLATMELLGRYKEQNHPFTPVIESLIKNTNSPDYAADNLTELLQAVIADRNRQREISKTLGEDNKS